MESESASTDVRRAESSLLDIARKTVAARYAVALLSARFGNGAGASTGESPTDGGVRMSPRMLSERTPSGIDSLGAGI